MNIYSFTKVLVTLLLVSTASNAQIALAYAKDEKNIGVSLAYHVEWNYSAYWLAEMHAKQYLKNKGYKNVYSQPCEDCGLNLEKGYYVVIKTTFKEWDTPHVSYGIGASAESSEQAEKLAIKQLSITDWSFSKSKGYQVIEKGTFSPGPVKQFIYIIKSRKTPCGESSFDFSYMLGMYPNALYVKIFNSIKKQNSSENPVNSKVGHIIKENGYIGVLKCNQKCPDGNVKNMYKVIEAETKEEINKLAPYDKESVSPMGMNNFFIHHIFDVKKDVESSILRETFNLFQKEIGIENKKILNDWGSSGVKD